MVGDGGAGDPGRGRDQGEKQTRRDRRALVVAPVHRRARVLRDERPAAARARVRPQGPGPGVRAGPGQGHRTGAGVTAPAVQGQHRRAPADHGAVADGRAAAGQPGAVPGETAGRRDARGDRGGLRRLRHAPVPAVGRRPGHALQLPGLGSAVQAPRRGLLCAGRGVRRRPVRDAGVARAQQGEPARRAARSGPAPRGGRAGRCAGGHGGNRRSQRNARRARRRDRAAARAGAGGLLDAGAQPRAAARARQPAAGGRRP